MMKKTFYIQILFVVATVAVCIFSTKSLISHVPDDYDRLYRINEWTQDTTIKPDIVFFGSSEAMNCVDGDFIASQFGKDVVSYTNTGQSVAEAFLFYSRIPSTTKAVVQVMRAGTFGEGIYINDVKANRLVIDGYRPDETTKSLLNQRTIDKLQKSFVEASFDIKGFVKNGIHSFLREALEPNQYCDSMNTYIRNAYMYSYERAPEDQYSKLLNSLKSEQATSLKTDDELVTSLKKANQYFREKGINFYIVLSPMSPRSSKIIPLDYKEALAKLNLGIPVIDLTHLLNEDGFADPVHPNRKGAKIFSKEVFVRINELCQE